MEIKTNPAQPAGRRAFEYTVLPARIRDDGEIVPGYPGQPGCIGWTTFKRYWSGYEQAGAIFGSEKAAIRDLWDSHHFEVSLAINYAAPREERL